MGVDEDLSSRLVAPEAVDDPNRPFTKGEKQPSSCRDAWAAILFYVQIAAIGTVCVMYGIPAFNKHVDAAKQEGEGKSEGKDEEGNEGGYEGIVYLVGVSAVCAFALSGVSLLLMACCPKCLIQISLLFSLVLSLCVGVACFISGNVIGGALGAIIFFINLCYAWCVWHRIPFAAANLNTGLTALKSNCFTFVMAYIFVGLTVAYSFIWSIAFLGVFDTTELIDEKGNVTESPTAYAYYFFLLLALFWSEQVFQNTMHAIVAGVVSTWWFVPEEASCCCSQAICSSTVRATTTSFGSICFGSLLVAIIQALRALVESARSNDDLDGCGQFLLCLVDCLLACLQGILEYFNKFAYIYVGIYGYSYLEAGKNVMNLFKSKGWTVIVNDDLISNTLGLFNLVVGLLLGGIGLLIKEQYPDWFVILPNDESRIAVAFIIPFLIGVVISAVMFSVVDSSVNTVIVCFAEGPAEFEENHPDLSSDMREAWRKVYPEECGF